MKFKNYGLAFVIPIIICLIALYFKGILKNIEYLYVSDLRLQHIVFLNYLWYNESAYQCMLLWNIFDMHLTNLYQKLVFF